MDFDLHGHHPNDVIGTGIFDKIVQQSWEMGEPSLKFIHGHGRNRGVSPGFVNTNTGRFGLAIRAALRNSSALRSFIVISSLDCSDAGSTTIRLKKNPKPIRERLDPELEIEGRGQYERQPRTWHQDGFDDAESEDISGQTPEEVDDET